MKTILTATQQFISPRENGQDSKTSIVVIVLLGRKQLGLRLIVKAHWKELTAFFICKEYLL
jgi:hypothetical protein